MKLSSAFPASASLLLFLALVPGVALSQEKDFAAGIQASAAFGGGSGTNASNFDTWGANVFGEMRIEKGTILQLRFGTFGLGGTIEDAPNLRIGYGDVLVGYIFHESWMDYGFLGGGGIFRVKPNEPEPGQIVIDKEENVLGLAIGATSIFRLTGRLDLRIEALLHYIYTQEARSPVLVGMGLAYRF